MAFVNDGEEIVGEIVQQAERSHPGTTSVKVPRIVLDAGAVAHLTHHLHVVGYTLVQPFGFGKTVLAGKGSHLGFTVEVNLTHRCLHAFLGGHEDVGGENLEAFHVLGGHLGIAVKNLDAFDFVAPKDDSQHDVLVAQEHIDSVALDAECAHSQLGVAARIQGVHQTVKQIIAPDLVAYLEFDGIGSNVLGVTHTIQARHARHHHNIATPRQQCRHRRETQALYLVVDGEVFFDILVGRGDIGLRLVVVIVGNEVVDRIFWKKTLELGIDLN